MKNFLKLGLFVLILYLFPIILNLFLYIIGIYISLFIIAFLFILIYSFKAYSIYKLGNKFPTVEKLKEFCSNKYPVNSLRYEIFFGILFRIYFKNIHNKSQEIIQNCLKRFNLSKKYTLAELKNKYRELAKKTHPDLGGDREEFEKIQSCYNGLKSKKE